MLLFAASFKLLFLPGILYRESIISLNIRNHKDNALLLYQKNIKLNVAVGPLVIFFISFHEKGKEVMGGLCNAYICMGRGWIEIS